VIGLDACMGVLLCQGRVTGKRKEDLKIGMEKGLFVCVEEI